VAGDCILMFARPTGVHKAHKWVWGLLGKFTGVIGWGRDGPSPDRSRSQFQSGRPSESRTTSVWPAV
jgi:hypothetical protein